MDITSVQANIVFAVGLSEQLSESLFHFPDRYQFNLDFLAVQSLEVVFGDKHAGEAQFLCFAYALLDTVYGADFSA